MNIGFDTIYDAIDSARDRYNWNKIVKLETIMQI